MTNTKKKSYVDETGMVIEPATELMKRVAIAATDQKKMKKDFTPAEIQEILERKRAGNFSNEENRKLSSATRAVKKWTRNRAIGDYSRIFLYPSYVAKSAKTWYKMMDFSALYFVYYLSERMGMEVQVCEDTDNYAKVAYIASVPDIDSVLEKFLKLGGKNVEQAMNGVYILTLSQPMTQDDYNNLVRIHGEKCNQVHDIMRPLKMKPVTYKLLMEMVRYFAPKVGRLEKRNFFALGEEIMRELSGLLNVYYMYSDTQIKKVDAKLRLLVHLNKIRANFMILQETNAWNDRAAVAMMGESLMRVRNQIMLDFKDK